MSARQRKLPPRIERTDPRLHTCAQLIEDELLDGWVNLDTKGNPIRILDARLTILGIAYLDQYEEEVARKEVRIKTPLGLWQLTKATAAIFCLLLFLYFIGRSQGNLIHANLQVTSTSQQADSLFGLSKTFGVCGVGPAE
jgi:hypothetical protein